MGKPTVDEAATALRAAIEDLDAHELRLAVHLYRALADGDPVEPADLASRASLDETTVRAALEAWPGVYRDDDGRVVGFWGLAIPEMAHRFQAEGAKPIHAWCAIDPFLIVPALGRNARVASKDPVTGEEITMTVTPDGVRDVSPPDTTVSFLVPAGPLDHDVIASFCHFVLNFASEDSASAWASERDDIVLYTVEEAFEIGRRAWAPVIEAARTLA